MSACGKLYEPANLLQVADKMTSGRPSSVDRRAIVLHFVMMAAAGQFVYDLHWDRQKGIEGSQRFLRTTNLDVITAEAIVWVSWLMGELWKADGMGNGKRDEDMFERVGFLTVGEATRMAVGMIQAYTGVDFSVRTTEGRTLYSHATKKGVSPWEPFATIVLRSVGCQSLTDPSNAIGRLPPPEWAPLAANVSLFYTTWPLAYYNKFKDFLRLSPYRFPHDEPL
jgi:hypothetical protein